MGRRYEPNPRWLDELIAWVQLIGILLIASYYLGPLICKIFGIFED